MLHLSFDNVSGTTVSNSGTGGSGMNGTLNSSANGTASIVSGGKFGNCLSISGASASDASCRIANAVVPLNVGAGNAWTVAMWVQTSTAGGCYAYQGSGGWDQWNTVFYLNQGSDGAPGTKAGGVRSWQGWEQGTTDINDGAWHHLVLTCDGTTKALYVDSVLETFTKNEWGGTGAGNQFWIGGNGSANDDSANLNGLIDEAYVFNRALSPSDITALFSNNTVPTVPVAVAVSPASGYRGQVITITATATPAIGTVTNATVNLSAIGLSSAANLVQSSANVFTSSFTVPTGTNAPIGNALLTVTAISTEPLAGSGGASYTVLARPPTNAIVSTQVTSATVYESTEASFHFATTNDAPNDASFPMTYAWYKNGVLVSTNPMGPYFTFLTTAADNNASIYAVARVADTNFSSLTVTSSVATLTVTPGTPVFTNGLKEEFFAGATRADVEIGNVGPGVVRLVSAADSTGGFGDNHARRYSGYFIPDTTDTYVFFIASDDDADLFLSTDSAPANKQLIAQETTWAGTRAWLSGGSILSQKRSDTWTNSVGETPYALGIPLTAGQLYYIESVMHNGGGGDNWAITYQTVADAATLGDSTASRMTAASNNIAVVTIPGSTLTWSAQPHSVTVYEGGSTNFVSLAISDAEMAPKYQWYLNNAPIANATGASLNMGSIPAAYDGAQVKVVATLPESALTITSSVVTISVLQAVSEVGFLKTERWNNQTSLANLENGSLGTPDFTMAINAFAGSIDNPSGINNFVRRISGYFIPATTGDYVFFTTGDDESDLFLSTDSTPANKRVVCQQGGWNTGGNWAWQAAGGGGATASQMRSDTWTPDAGLTYPYAAGISLVAGTKYYIEQDWHQGGGGANNAATFKLVSDPDPAIGTPTRFTGSVIGTSAIRCDTVTITQQPTNVTVIPMGYVQFSADGTTDSTLPVGSIYGYEEAQVGNYLFFQWYKNGVAISGANSKKLTLGPILPGDNNASITCSVRALGYANSALTPIWVNSTAATITVAPQAIFEPGIIRADWWTNNDNKATVENNLAGLPTFSYVVPNFETAQGGSDYNNYVSRASGFFTAPVAGNYVFYVNSDPESDLFISTTGNPANKVLIAQETGWSGNYLWSTANGGSSAAQKRSDYFTPDLGYTYPGNPGGVGGIPLTAGQVCWLEGVYHSYIYGEHFEANYRLSTDPELVDGTVSKLGPLMGDYVPRIPWVAFLQQPTPSQTVTSGNPVTFTVAATNAPSVWVGTTRNPGAGLTNLVTDSTQYQWLLNGSIIPGATSASYTRDVLPSDAGKAFVCQLRALGYADNAGTRIWSNSLPAVLTVVTDTVPPTISYAVAFQNTNQASAPYIVDVTFSKGMNATSLSNATYTINGVTVTNKSVSSNKRTVQLTLDGMPTLPLNITVTGVTDLSGNAIVANTAAINAEKLTFTDVGTPGVNPLSPSIVWVTGDGGYQISSQGNDIWDAADAFNFGWEIKTNDFDVAVRGVSIGEGVSTWSKMGLMVREDLTAASRNWSMFNEPTVGANRIEAGMRDVTGAASTGTGWQIGTPPAPSFPNAWLRLTRTGAVLDGYYSTDGANWVHAASYDTSAAPLPAEVYVGIASTSHNNGTYNMAEYANYGSPLVFTRLTISLSGSDVIVSWTPAGGHLEASPAISGSAVNWQPVGGGNPATIPVGAGERFFRVVTP